MEDKQEPLVIGIRCESIEQKNAITKLLEEIKKLDGFTHPIIVYRALKMLRAGL